MSGTRLHWHGKVKTGDAKKVPPEDYGDENLLGSYS